MMVNLAFTLVLLPLFTSIITGLFGHKMGERNGMMLSTVAVVISFILSAYLFVEIAILGKPSIEADLYSWIQVGQIDVSFGVLVDKLTSVMLLVVTSVSAMVHIYSWGYMSHDKSKTRFFSYLNLFTFVMLSLVSANNMVQMFFGWEGVGLASYLLIGFWHHKDSANKASMKAFIVNRVADLFLILALITTLDVFGTFNYADIFASLDAVKEQTYTFFNYDVNVLVLITLFLLLGAMGKSAQFGFHTWLPDAMEGPTPVSALIHAATMVTAGVFLIARMSPMYELAGPVLQIVAIVGGVTAIFAATIGLTQTDIKRVIAYSTCSQLGYMFFALGVSAYTAAIFHLMTHAFFKAMLFLGAGSVIHGLSDEQDMRKMGRIWKLMPVTYGLMWLGSLALAGVPPFAGFFSKDFILESAFMSHTPLGTALYWVGVTAAFMTAFYSFRLLFMTFHGKDNVEKEVREHAHESPRVMVWPMLFLALGAVFSGYLGMSMTHTDWWQGAIYINEEIHVGVVEAHHIPPLFKYLPLGVVFVGILLAYVMYFKGTNIPQKLANAVKPLYQFSLRKWYIDEVYEALIVNPVKGLGKALWQGGDVNTIDRLGPNGVAYVTAKTGQAIRKLQSGFMYHYAFIMILGLVGLVTYFVMM